MTTPTRLGSPSANAPAAFAVPSRVPPGAPAGRIPRSRELVLWLFCAFSVALTVPFWMGTHVPNEDGLAHLAWTEVYRALGAPESPWASAYARSVTWVTPNLAYFGLQYALGAVVDPHLAQRLILSALVVAWAAAAYWLSVLVWGRLTVGAFTSLLLIHSSWLYGGYLSFLVGVPLLIVALALVARIWRAADDVPRGSLALLAVVGVCAFYAHLVAAAIFLMLIGLAALAFRDRARRRIAVALTSLPTLVLVAAYLASATFGPGGMRWEPAGRTVARFAGLAFFRGFAAPTADFWIALGLLGVVLLVQGRAVVRGRWLHAPAPSGPLSRFVLVAAACLAVLYFLVPDGVGEAYNLKGRLQLVMWAWLLPSLPATRDVRSRKIVIAIASVLLGWQVIAFSERARRFNDAYDRVLSAASALPRGTALSRANDYGHESFDGSFIKVLAHTPEDVAFHCGCVLLGGYHPSTSFYWVRSLDASGIRAARTIQIRQLPNEPPTFSVRAAGATTVGVGGATK